MKTTKTLAVLMVLSLFLANCGKFQDWTGNQNPNQQFVPFSPYNGLNPNLLGDFAAAYPNASVMGPNGYQEPFRNYYANFYGAGYPSQGYSVNFGGGSYPMNQLMNPNSRNYYLNLNYQKNPFSGNTNMGGMFGIGQ